MHVIELPNSYISLNTLIKDIDLKPFRPERSSNGCENFKFLVFDVYILVQLHDEF